MTLTRASWRYPEWWTLAISAAAWALILIRSQTMRGQDHAMHADASSFLGSAVVDWLLMVAAMMLPLMVGSIRTTAARSFWRRRHRAISIFLAGYLTPWSGLGVVAVLVAMQLPAAARAGAAAAVFVAAALWELTSAKRRALLSCHRTMPLAPTGWRADRDCFAYGYATSLRCVASCWAVMLGCALAQHSAPVMAAVGVVSAAERYSFRPHPRVASAAVLGIACVALYDFFV
jgi:hypothetical protein